MCGVRHFSSVGTIKKVSFSDRRRHGTATLIRNALILQSADSLDVRGRAPLKMLCSFQRMARINGNLALKPGVSACPGTRSHHLG
jgi:hypothetical protein